MTNEQWSEGRDGAVASYRERLTPPWWVWIVGVAIGAPLAVAYGSAFGGAAGWLVFVCYLVLVIAVLVGTSPLLRIDEHVVRAGRARLPLQFVGEIVPLDAAHMRSARGSNGDPSAYLVIRNWYAPAGVLIEVTDVQDPHPYWLVTTRRPERFADALAAARAAALPPKVEPRTHDEENP